MPDTHPKVVRNMIREALDVLLEPGSVAEMRVIGSKRGTQSGYYENLDVMAHHAFMLDGDVPNIYVTPNPVLPDLLARAVNRMEHYAKCTTGDEHILRRRWFLVDFDPVRPKGISATDAEHEAGLERARACREWLRRDGWPEPVFADSGNGAHLNYRVELPNDDDVRQLFQRALQALAFKFTDSVVEVDTKTFNAARIWKLYGTLACKGDAMLERPHRRSAILERPEEAAVASCELLERLANVAPAAGAQVHRARSTRFPDFDIDRWLVEHALPVASEGSWNGGGRKWVLNPCPWNPEHTNRSAYIVQFPSGAIAAGCHHNGCAGKDWKALRALFEPASSQRRARTSWTLTPGKGTVRVG